MYAFNFTLVQFLLSEPDYRPSLLDTSEEAKQKNRADKGIRPYFPNTLYEILTKSFSYLHGKETDWTRAQNKKILTKKNDKNSKTLISP